jgi:hypothetical protein
VDLVEIVADAVLLKREHLVRGGMVAAVFFGRAEIVRQARRGLVGPDVFLQLDVRGDPLCRGFCCQLFAGWVDLGQGSCWGRRICKSIPSVCGGYFHPNGGAEMES